MNSTALAQQPEKLPLLIERAAAALTKATTAAEFLEARDQAAFVYDAAKMAARFAKAKEAHDEILAACRKAQADALLIEARAEMRLAEEYDAAQARGEAAKYSSGNPQIVPDRNDLPKTAAELGLTRKVILEARRVRDAEKAKPGLIRETVDKLLAAGEEPTRAHVRRAVDEVLEPPKPAQAAPREESRRPLTQEQETKMVCRRIVAGIILLNSSDIDVDVLFDYVMLDHLKEEHSHILNLIDDLMVGFPILQELKERLANTNEAIEARAHEEKGERT